MESPTTDDTQLFFRINPPLCRSAIAMSTVCPDHLSQGDNGEGETKLQLNSTRTKPILESTPHEGKECPTTSNKQHTNQLAKTFQLLNIAKLCPILSLTDARKLPHALSGVGRLQHITYQVCIHPSLLYAHLYSVLYLLFFLFCLVVCTLRLLNVKF